MKEEICVLPVRCGGCSKVFDLWHVLQEQEQAKNVVSEEYEMKKLINQSLCYDCRKELLDELENTISSGEHEEDYEFEMEYE